MWFYAILIYHLRLVEHGLFHIWWAPYDEVWYVSFFSTLMFVQYVHMWKQTISRLFIAFSELGCLLVSVLIVILLLKACRTQHTPSTCIRNKPIGWYWAQLTITGVIHSQTQYSLLITGPGLLWFYVGRFSFPCNHPVRLAIQTFEMCNLCCSLNQKNMANLARSCKW